MVTATGPDPGRGCGDLTRMIRPRALGGRATNNGVAITGLVLGTLCAPLSLIICPGSVAAVMQAYFWRSRPCW